MKTSLPKQLNLLVLILLSGLFLFPLLITVTNSFMPEAEIVTNYTAKLSVFDVQSGVASKFMKMRLLPNLPTLHQYQEVLVNQPAFLRLLLNSLKIALPVVLGNLVVSLLSAYGFTIWQSKYKEAVFLVYIIVMLMPLQAVLVPNFIITERLGISASYLAIILPGIFSPFGTFLLRQSMKAIPYEYIEAARMDGEREGRILLKVIVPQMKSALAALAMLLFIEYWNLVEQVIVFIRDSYNQPLSVYLSRISSDNVSIVFAASCIYMFLPFYCLVMGQQNLKKGIEMSGIK